MLIEVNASVIEQLSKTEAEIVAYINANEAALSQMSIVDIAHATYSSPSTVSRAIRKCGMNGFNELRYRSTTKVESHDIKNIGEVMNKSLVEAQRVFEQISYAGVLDIVRAIREAKRIYVFARGLSSYVGQEFTLKLQLLDYNVFFSDDSNIIKKKAQSITKDQVLMNFSLNGETVELIEAAQKARMNQAKVITCCCNENSKLIPLSTYSLIGFKHSHIAIKEFEVSSRIPLYMISRIIIDCLTSERKK